MSDTLSMNNATFVDVARFGKAFRLTVLQREAGAFHYAWVRSPDDDDRYDGPAVYVEPLEQLKAWDALGVLPGTLTPPDTHT